MKRKVTIRMICLIVAAVVLSGSLMVAAFTGSPYGTLKNSLLDAMMLKNAVVRAEMSYSIDGVVQETEKSDGAFTETASYSKMFDELGAEYGFYYSTDNMQLRTDYLALDGTQWYYGWLFDSRYFSHSSSLFGIGNLTEEDRNSATMRFVELAVDALVGDLKNNITMTADNGVRHVSGTLTGSQIPELARTGLDMLVEQNGGYGYEENIISIDLAAGTRILECVNISNMQKNVYTYEQTFRTVTEEELEGGYRDVYFGNFYYPVNMNPGGGYETIDESVEYLITSNEWISHYQTDATRADFAGRDPMDMPLKSVDISYVHGEADIDANGNLTNLSLNGTATVTNVFGESFTLDMRVELDITDIGTAVVQSPIPDAEYVLTKDFIKDKIGNSDNGFYFKLNPDGTIDRSSVTTTYPGELYKAPKVEAAEPSETDALPDEIDELTGMISGLEPVDEGVIIPEDDETN